jgi:hypothetical protein
MRTPRCDRTSRSADARARLPFDAQALVRDCDRKVIPAAATGGQGALAGERCGEARGVGAAEVELDKRLSHARFVVVPGESHRDRAVVKARRDDVG